MGEFVDHPMEVTLTDGSRWIVYYRDCMTFANALLFLWRDVREGTFVPADDLDGVQRRSAQINAAHIVSVREVERSHD